MTALQYVSSIPSTEEAPTFIFDLDGTLADISHRLHIKEQMDNPNRWADFYAACEQDVPITPVIHLLETLLDSGKTIRIVSGREASVRSQTILWLCTHTNLNESDLTDWHLIMRPVGVRAPDQLIKRNWLRSLPPKERAAIVLALEDRTRCVDMWRAEGVPCMQVAPGDF